MNQKKTQQRGQEISLRGAIFDLDGTILDSMPCWETVGIRYLVDRSIDIPDVQELARRLKTTTLPQAAQLYREEFGVTDSVETICRDILDRIAHDYRCTVPLKPHVRSVLERLHAQGVPMCIATATDHELAEAALRRLQVQQYFQFIHTCQELHTTKFESYIFDRSADQMGVERKDVVVFEDAIHSIETAARAGYRVVAVYDRSSDADLSEIKKLSDLFLWDWSGLQLSAAPRQQASGGKPAPESIS